MTNSREWCAWSVVAAAVFLVAAFIGGTWLAVAAYVLVRALVSIGGLLVIAVAVSRVTRP